MAEPIKTTSDTENMTNLSTTSPETTAEQITLKSERIIKLITADQYEFSVEESVARQLETVRAFIDEEGFDDSTLIPLFNVSSKPLAMIIEYYKKHQEFSARTETADDSGEGSDDVKSFDEEFAKDTTEDEIKELLIAANYLNAKDLLNLLFKKVAHRIENKSVEYVRKFFGIETDYTPEEEAQFREQNSWAFEGVDEDEVESKD